VTKVTLEKETTVPDPPTTYKSGSGEPEAFLGVFKSELTLTKKYPSLLTI